MMATMAIHFHSQALRRLVLSLALLVSAFVVVRANGEQTRLLRSPTVSATQIAFAYANNIWVVERGGGSARRLRDGVLGVVSGDHTRMVLLGWVRDPLRAPGTPRPSFGAMCTVVVPTSDAEARRTP